MGTEPSGNLSRYPAGGLRQLLGVSFPLMLSAASGYCMLLGDRFILSRYSISAMNAAAATGGVFAVFKFFFLAIVLVAEVFVGRYNGARRYSKIGAPVWQMIWFSLFASLFFIPVGHFLGPLFIAQEFEALGAPYFRCLMYLGTFGLMTGALSAFFIGRGETHIVTLTSLAGNLLNLGLDFVFIWGIAGIIPPMGTWGAALATGLSEAFQAVLLFMLFLKKRNRKVFGTGEWRFQKPLFWKCMSIGWPNSLAHFMEITAWALLYQVIAPCGEKYVTVTIMNQNIFFLFAFVTEGLQKGITALASNFLGADDKEGIKKLVRSLFYFTAIAGISSTLVIYLGHKSFVKSFVGTEILERYPDFMDLARQSIRWYLAFMLMDCWIWSINGLLTAGGDTRFTLIANSLNVWLLCVIPVCVIVHYGHDFSYIWKLLLLYGFFNMVCFYWRFRSNRWQKIAISTLPAPISQHE